MTDLAVLGAAWTAVYRPRVAVILDRQTERIYRFRSEGQYIEAAKNGSARHNQLLVDEILYRAHAAALAALGRSYQWCLACEAAHDAENVYGLVAGMRGLLEAAGDAALALGSTAMTLAANMAEFQRLRHDPRFRIAKDCETATRLEDNLIHFLFGRRLDKPDRANFPKSHDAERKGASYIAAISKAKEKQLLAFWGELCEISHPALMSIWPFIEFESSKLVYRRLSYGAMRASVIDTHAELIDLIVQAAFNPSLMTLGVLNHYRVPLLATSGVEDRSLMGINAWAEILPLLTRQGDR